MYLYKLKVQGLRKIFDTEIYCNQSTFLVGPNNSSKTTFLKAIDILLSSSSKVNVLDFYSLMDDEQNIPLCTVAKEIVIEGEFRDVDVSYKTRRGFKGRIIDYEPGTTGETGCSFIIRKKFNSKCDLKFEIYSQKRSFKTIFNWGDVIGFGASKIDIENDLGKDIDVTKKPSTADLNKLAHFDELYEYEELYEWTENPGGLITVFNRNLPRFLLVPAIHDLDHFGSRGTLATILNSIFDELKETSPNYIEASKYLKQLSGELDPTDTAQEFGKLLSEINDGFDGVFPGAALSVKVDLSDPKSAITPKYDIKAKSNIETKIEMQGTGLSRSAVFSLLKFHAEWKERREAEEGAHGRKIIIGFEEPEIYLHPSASRLIRDFIYDLASKKSIQIIATTHATEMIDLNNTKVYQVINHCKTVLKEFPLESKNTRAECTEVNCFKHSEEFLKLASNDRKYLKMLLAVDERFSNAFFVSKVIVFEGNTEEVVIKESIDLIEQKQKTKILSDTGFINARGKATIISIVNYLKALGVEFKVIHDSDTGVVGAEKFNIPIATVAGPENVLALETCIEDVLGYKPPASEKPFRAFTFIKDNWQGDISKASDEWKIVINFLFNLNIS